MGPPCVVLSCWLEYGNTRLTILFGRVQAVVSEIPAKASQEIVRPALGHGVDLDALRTALRGVESVGDELELRNRVAAEARLHVPQAPAEVRHLLAIDVHLIRPAPFGRDLVGADPVDPIP